MGRTGPVDTRPHPQALLSLETAYDVYGEETKAIDKALETRVQVQFAAGQHEAERQQMRAKGERNKRVGTENYDAANRRRVLMPRNPITSLPEFRKYADRLIADLPIFKFPRNQAILHVFRTLQTCRTLSLPGAGYETFYHGMRNIQDLLRYFTFKAFELCPPPAGDVYTSLEHRTIAINGVNECHRFSLIHDATVRFENDSSSFVGEISSDLLRSYANSQLRLLQAPLLPEHYSLGPYTLGEFRSFWAFLRAYAEVHECGLFTALALPGTIAALQGRPVTNSAISLSAGDLAKVANSATGLPEATVLEIVRDLTYAPDQVPWVDIMHQPLVPTGDEKLSSIPVVLGHSNFERNLLAIVEKIPWRSDAAVTLREGRETLMLEEIVPELEQLGLHTKCRLPLGPSTQRLGDIDLLSWDADTKNALAVSLKWFYGPDSIQEVLNHDDWYRDGLQKHREHIGHVKQNAEDLSARFDLRPQLSSETRLFGALVSKLEFGDYVISLPAGEFLSNT